MSSFFPREFLPPKTIACPGLCQLQVLLAADAPASLPIHAKSKDPIFGENRVGAIDHFSINCDRVIF